jgi:hypothetical protein
MKPREFKSETLPVRAVCAMEDSERVVDTRIDLNDDKTSAAELRRYAKWLLNAAKWLESK